MAKSLTKALAIPLLDSTLGRNRELNLIPDILGRVCDIRANTSCRNNLRILSFTK